MRAYQNSDSAQFENLNGRPDEFHLQHGPPFSQPKLIMRAKSDQFEAIVIWLAVDQNQIWLDVAVAVVVHSPDSR